MTVPKRLTIKFFIDNPAPAASIIPIFQRWIQRNQVEGLLIDVVDYQHVYKGPGIILIAHEGDYAYDFGDNRAGIQYTLKQTADFSLREALSITLRRVLQAIHQLDNEQSVDNLQINSSEFQIMFRDRLNYPNNATTQLEIISKIRAVLSENYGSELSITAVEGDSRDPLTLQVKNMQQMSLVDVFSNLTVSEG